MNNWPEVSWLQYLRAVYGCNPQDHVCQWLGRWSIQAGWSFGEKGQFSVFISFHHPSSKAIYIYLPCPTFSIWAAIQVKFSTYADWFDAHLYLNHTWFHWTTRVHRISVLHFASFTGRPPAQFEAVMHVYLEIRLNAAYSQECVCRIVTSLNLSHLNPLNFISAELQLEPPHYVALRSRTSLGSEC